MRTPRRPVLSVKAGPVPVPVVPIACSPRSFSSSSSMARCHGITTCARSLTRTREVSTPRLASISNSSISECGLMTTPLPMTQVVSAWKMPAGTRCRPNFPRSFTIVWPALLPAE